MIPPLPEHWIDLFLDGELTPAERELAEQLLANEPLAREEWEQARELDMSLTQALPPPVLEKEWLSRELVRQCSDENVPDAVLHDFMSATASPSQAAGAHGRFAILATIAVLVLTILMIQGNEAGGSGIATLQLSTGVVEVLEPRQELWRPLPRSRRVALMAGTRLRTPEKVVCELVTHSRGVVRVGESAEIILNQSDDVELRTGQFWVKAAPDRPCQVRVATLASVTPPVEQAADFSVFTCPENSSTAWNVDDVQTYCVSVGDDPMLVRAANNQSWSIAPGEAMACSSDREPEIAFATNRIDAVSWQLPLLALRPPHDPELQGLLSGLLATIGRSKIGGLYDHQIRELGPAGTIPLIAYVRSKQSESEPDTRRHAMQIVADLAPESSRRELELLATDADEQVARLSLAAIRRLNGVSDGP